MPSVHLVAGFFASRAAADRVLSLAAVGPLRHRLRAFGEPSTSRPLDDLAAAWLRPGELLLLIDLPEDEARTLQEVLLRSGEAIHVSILTPNLILPRPPAHASLSTRWAYSVGFIQQNLRRQIEQSSETMSRTPAKWGVAESAYADNMAGISLIEHRYIIDGYIERISGLLKGTRGLRQLPLGQVDGVVVPFVYQIGLETELALRGRLNENRLRRYLRKRLALADLKRGEFKSIEPMLVVALMEDLAIQVASELRHEAQVRLARLAAERIGGIPAGEFEPYLRELGRVLPSPPADLSGLVLELIRDQPDRQSALAALWKLPTGERLIRRLRRAQRRDAERLERFNRVVTSLRALTRADWETLIEDISPVVAILRTDPSGHFPRLDGPTRAWYADRVAEIAKWSGRTERGLATSLVERATRASGVERHIGYHLIDTGRRPFERAMGASVPVGLWLYLFARRHPAGWLIGWFTSLLVLLWLTVCYLLSLSVSGPGWFAVTALVSILPVSQIALEFTVYLTAKVTRPMSLPKLRFPRAIPEVFRTAVVVPTMLRNANSVRADLRGLEVRYLANPDGGLSFGLLTDFPDATCELLATDQPLVDAAIQGLQDLQTRYPSGHFFLFHRPRTWNPFEESWMGEERKRGKLEAFNHFLMGAGDASHLLVGDSEQIRASRFVITLDEDTELPPGAGKRLVETLAHPLNEPHLDAAGRGILRGFSIIQPRVTTSLESGRATRLSRLLGGRVGVDPYMVTYSDLYFDLARDAIYHGKGIYDPRAFDSVLAGRLPQERVLSHDLLEGSYAKVALATDITLFDSFPSTSSSLLARDHRWVRGDWQIAAWIGRRVPLAGGRSESNPLSRLTQWKITDNLRRSLLPLGTTAIFIVAFLQTASVRDIMLALAFTSVFTSLLLQLPGLIITLLLLRNPDWSGLGGALADGTYRIMMAPRQAWLNLDAIIRVWYRLNLTHRLLLQWKIAADVSRLAGRGIDLIAAAIGIVALIAYAQLARHPSLSSVIGLVILGLWTLAPLYMLWLDRAAPDPLPSSHLTPTDRRFLRRIGLQTWRFFDELMTAENHFLPPDNYQVTLKLEVARRTSPTNIGLGLLAWQAARDLGLITSDQLTARTTLTLESLAALETYRGHIYNWYRIDNLEPLPPRYVSMVDSGNLMASLWAFRQGLIEEQTRPLIETVVIEGWRDLLEEFKARVPRAPKSVMAELLELTGTAEAARTPAAQTRALRNLVLVARARSAELRSAAAGQSQVFLAERLIRQATAWEKVIADYLDWFLLASCPPADVVRLLPAAHRPALDSLLESTPSLQTVAVGKLPLPGVTGEAPEVRAWWAKVNQSYQQSATRASAAIDRIRSLADEAGRLADRTDMRFLYNRNRRVFHIGYNLEETRLDASFYDLLASEARLGSFTAIAAGQVPPEHWWSLGRNSRRVDGLPVLLAWSGTMFEYLLPRLLMDPPEGTLLNRAARSAVEIQRRYGQALEIPWGISESAHAALDYDNTYQYQAFGVPALGISSGLSRGLVVAPYASLLALAENPTAVLSNLKHLEKLGFRGDMGYFEAVDYRRAATASGERGVGAFTYMAHHQAMGLVSIANTLTANPFPRRFAQDLRVSAARTLLHERAARPGKSKQDTSLRKVHPLSALSVNPVVVSTAALTDPLPKVHVLTNGHYTVMVTTTGSGFSRWGHIEINRWSTETLRGERGNYVYLRDLKLPDAWSTSFEPTLRDDASYRVTFRPEKAVFERTQNELSSREEIYVAPDHDVEVRRIRLKNDSPSVRDIEATSVLEFGLVPHAAQISHPAFQKLFIGIEPLPEQDGILATRRPRAAGEPAVWAAHLLVNLTSPASRASLQTDREDFLSRSGTPSAPAGLSKPTTTLPEYPLDPIAAVTQHVALAPGEAVELAALTIVASTREEVIRLAGRYRQWSGLSRSRQVAWSLRQAELRRLQVTESDAAIFQDLTPYLIYPNYYFKQAAKGLVPGESSHTISHDELPAGPCMVATIDDMSDMLLARQLGLAQKYLTARGLNFPLVILVKLSGDVGNRLTTQLRELAESLNWLGEASAKPDIHIWSLSHLSQGTLDELTRRARVVFDGSDGSLASQLASVAPLARGLGRPLLTPAAPATLPALAGTAEFAGSGYGGFTAGGQAYTMTVSPDTITPAPWSNVIANARFGSLITERGGGFTWMSNSQEYRLSPWRNEPLLDVPGELLYVQDLAGGQVWSPQPGFHPTGSALVTHAAGRTDFEGEYDGLQFRSTQFVPTGWHGPQTVKITRLNLNNPTSKPRRVRLTFYTEWVLGTNRETWQEQLVTGWNDAEQMVTAINPRHPDYPATVAFAALSRPLTDFTTDRTEFLGPIRGDELPHGLSASELSGRIGQGLDPVAVLRCDVEIPAGNGIEVDCYLGTAPDPDAAVVAVNKLRGAGTTSSALAATGSWWDKTLGVIEIESPARDTDILMNRWLVYQTLTGRVWGRTGYYQSSGAYGFRDQLQDSLALMYARPEITRDIIMESARHQFKEGDTQHWWMPGTVRGLRTTMSDDRLWLPFVVTKYVATTGDYDLLNQDVPYLEAPLLSPGQHDSYAEHAISEESGTILDHCLRAIAISATAGAHGLPLIGTGDWNDGFSEVGSDGSGESVWLGWFEIAVLDATADLLDLLHKRPKLATAYRARAKAYTLAIDQSAWDGNWYLRAFYDDGSPLGTASDAEASIDSIAQSWSVIAGTGRTDRQEQAVASALSRLVDRKAGIVKLLTPAFDKTTKNPGYIKGYLPGVRENGGQYTHAALWLAQATAKLGHGAEAIDLLRLINPINHALDRSAADRYRIEPYVMAGDVYALPGQEGRGGWSWYTGSSAWTYRIWLEDIFGFRMAGTSLEIDPCIHHDWPGFKLTYRYKSATYVIEVQNPHHVSRGVAEQHLDGRLHRRGPIKLVDDGATHYLVVRLGF